MTSQEPRDFQIFLEQLRNVTDVKQLAQEFKAELQIMVEAIKVLNHRYEHAAI